jgi:hypothetical protein
MSVRETSPYTVSPSGSRRSKLHPVFVGKFFPSNVKADLTAALSEHKPQISRDNWRAVASESIQVSFVEWLCRGI